MHRRYPPVTCKSLDSRVIFISLSLLDLNFQSSLFHFHFSKRVKGKTFSPFFLSKRVKFDTKFQKKLTIWGGFRTQNKVRQEWFLNSRKFSRNFTSRSWSFFISLSLLDLDFQSFSFHFHFSISISSHFFSLALLEKSEWHFFFTFHFSTVQNPLSQSTV